MLVTINDAPGIILPFLNAGLHKAQRAEICTSSTTATPDMKIPKGGALLYSGSYGLLLISGYTHQPQPISRLDLSEQWTRGRFQDFYRSRPDLPPKYDFLVTYFETLKSEFRGYTVYEIPDSLTSSIPTADTRVAAI